MLTEQFKPIKGYEGRYEVSNMGTVRSLFRKTERSNGRMWTVKEKILKPCLNTNGYYKVALTTKHKVKFRYIHQLVWEHFGDRARDKYRLTVDHIDGNKTNNFIGNLRLLSNRDNITAWHRKNRLNKIPTGVQFIKDINKYQSRICINYKFISLGYYDNINDASLAYQNKLKSINKGAK